MRHFKKIVSFFRKMKYVFFLHRLFYKKTVVLIISTMRSGSTLLKALLANATDVTNIPEQNFQKYSKWDYYKDKMRHKERIIVLKRPAKFSEAGSYPILPDIPNVKQIILIRDVYDTVSSLKLMHLELSGNLLSNEQLINDYWVPVYKGIINRQLLTNKNTMVVRYEDLVDKSLIITKTIFDFIGSEQGVGVNTYTKPKHYKWRWGSDDGGDTIKSLKVQKNNKEKSDRELLEFIESSKHIKIIKDQFGYKN